MGQYGLPNETLQAQERRTPNIVTGHCSARLVRADVYRMCVCVCVRVISISVLSFSLLKIAFKTLFVFGYFFQFFNHQQITKIKNRSTAFRYLVVCMYILILRFLKNSFINIEVQCQLNRRNKETIDCTKKIISTYFL